MLRFILSCFLLVIMVAIDLHVLSELLREPTLEGKVNLLSRMVTMSAAIIGGLLAITAMPSELL